eukprot:jgi/Chrpa1/24403/Chrysochromulina_OHIO_Genome00023069-RA
MSRPTLHEYVTSEAGTVALQADTGDGGDNRIAWQQRLVAPPLHHDVLFHVLCSHVGAAPIVWRGDYEVPRRTRTVGGHARRRDGVKQRVFPLAMGKGALDAK